MAYWGIPLGNAILMALCFVSYVAGKTETIESHIIRAVYLADVTRTDTHRFESQIRFSQPLWFRAGMRIFAYRHNAYFWKKRHLTWALTNDPVVMTRREVISAMEHACEQWGAVSPFTFEQVSLSQQLDIRLTAVPRNYIKYAVEILRHGRRYELDRDGVTIRYAITTEWSDRNRKDWANLRMFILKNLGKVLGMDVSDVRGAAMYPSYEGNIHPGAVSPYDYNLTKDDIDGIQKKY